MWYPKRSSAYYALLIYPLLHTRNRPHSQCCLCYALQNMSSPSRQKSMGERALREFLCDIKCYDLVPVSSKVLACDMDISLRLAFYAFVEHGA